MTRTGRILSKDAEKWFADTYTVSIGGRKSPGFIITHRTTRHVVGRGKYLAVLAFAKNQYVQHCRHNLNKGDVT